MSWKFCALVVLLFLHCFNLNYSANILCMFTDCVHQNLIVFMAVANTLIDRGHNVTIVTTIPIPWYVRPKASAFRHIYLENPLERIRELKYMHFYMYNETNPSIMVYSYYLSSGHIFTFMQRDALQRAKFQEFLREDNKFDLMVLGYYYNDFMVGVAARYECPIAVISLCAPFSTLNRLIGNPPAVSYVQIAFTGNNHPMNFVDRLRNFALNAVDPLVQIYTDFMMDSIYRTLFPDESYPSYFDVISNISLVLYNRHFSEMPIRPLVPALVEIGGIQDEDQSEFLPQDIKEFLDAAEHGAIFFRVGSIARSTELKPDQIAIILNELSNLDQRTVWEWERTEKLPPTNYSNIMFRPFIVPNTILPHPNIKLYITDGRPLGIHEATYHGVPMLGLPLFGEELYAVEEMRNRDFGTSLDVNTMTAKSFNETLRKVLHSPFYAEKVKQFSQLFRDRPNTARETAAFWLEYVIRHRGALHMQSPLVHMNFVKRWNIDVIVVLLVAAWVFVKLALFTGVLVRVIVDQMVRRRRMRYKMKFH